MAALVQRYMPELFETEFDHMEELADELAAWLRAADLQLEDVSGLFYDPLRQRARLSARTGVNYLACATRPGVAA